MCLGTIGLAPRHRVLHYPRHCAGVTSESIAKSLNSVDECGFLAPYRRSQNINNALKALTDFRAPRAGFGSFAQSLAQPMAQPPARDRARLCARVPRGSQAGQARCGARHLPFRHPGPLPATGHDEALARTEFQLTARGRRLRQESSRPAAPPSIQARRPSPPSVCLP